MTTNQPLQTLKGFRDFLPEEKRKRDFVAKKIKEIFEKYGFEPLETPTLEYASLLLGKYGKEADKLVYTFEDRGGREIALRYDQTVPSARVLAQYQGQLPKNFRRYQIQNVYRADKPQKGRFREFTQCDIDIFGSTSTVADAEILTCTYFALKNVGFSSVSLKINDRETLVSTLTPFATKEVPVFSITQTLDKLDKVSGDDVVAELVDKGLSHEAVQAALENCRQASISPRLTAIIDQAVALGVPRESLVFTPVLARGLDYYTGMIFEIIIQEYSAGSLGGGGRYDNLISQLSGLSMPAVGVGLGFDRIVEIASQLGLVTVKQSNANVLITFFSEELIRDSLEVAKRLREKGIAVEVYPALDKLGQQFKTANQKNIPFTLVIGEEEKAQGKIALKNMETGSQEILNLDEVVERLR